MKKEEASLLFKALSDPNRVKIVKVLQNNDEICACDLLNIVECKQATLSHHLRTLYDAGLLVSRREGKNVIYSIDRNILNELISFLGGECDECKKSQK